MAASSKVTLSQAIEQAVNSQFTGSLSFGKEDGKIFLVYGNLINAVSGLEEGLGAITALARKFPKTVTVAQEENVPAPGSNLAGTPPEKLFEVIKQEQALLQKSKPSTLANPLPLLPGGKTIFENVALAAINLDVLLTTIPTGMGVVSIATDTSLGTVLVKDNAKVGAYFEHKGELTVDDSALDAIRSLKGATVSVYVLPKDLLELLPALIDTPIAYAGLQLSWIDFDALVKELASRPGPGMVEISTNKGRGVLILQGGRKLAYTEFDRTPKDPAVLAPLLKEKSGSVRVRHSSPPKDVDSPKKDDQEMEQTSEEKTKEPLSAPTLVSSAEPPTVPKEQVATPPLVQKQEFQTEPSSQESMEEELPAETVAPEETTLPTHKASNEETPTTAMKESSLETLFDIPATEEVDEEAMQEDEDTIDETDLDIEANVDDVEVEKEPADDLFPFGEITDSKASSAYPREAMERLAASELGPTAARLAPLFATAEKERWEGSKLEEEVGNLSIRAIDQDHLRVLGKNLAKLLQS